MYEILLVAFVFSSFLFFSLSNFSKQAFWSNATSIKNNKKKHFEESMMHWIECLFNFLLFQLLWHAFQFIDCRNKRRNEDDENRTFTILPRKTIVQLQCVCVCVFVLLKTTVEQNRPKKKKKKQEQDVL